MEIILTEKIRNVGNIGDKVQVKDGYGRNYLIPNKKAVPANAKNIAEFEARRHTYEEAANQSLANAQKRSDGLSILTLTLKAQASEEGKLYGSIGTRQIAEAIQAQGHAIEKREVILSKGVLRELGEYEVDLQLHSDVTTKIKVIIEAEKTI